MEQKFIDKMRGRLIAKKSEIEEELQSVSKEDTGGRYPGDAEATKPEYGDSEEENADEVVAYQENLSTASNLESHLEEVNSALEKIVQDKYGYCEKCNIELSEERLEAFPAAKNCIDCSKKQ